MAGPLRGGRMFLDLGFGLLFGFGFSCYKDFGFHLVGFVHGGGGSVVGFFDLDSGVDDALRELWSLFRSSHVRRPRSGGQCWRTGWRVAVRAWRRRGLAGQAAPVSPFTEDRRSTPGYLTFVCSFYPAAFPKPPPRGLPTARQTHAHFHLLLARFFSLYGG